jgi:hypothetical protein
MCMCVFVFECVFVGVCLRACVAHKCICQCNHTHPQHTHAHTPLPLHQVDCVMLVGTHYMVGWRDIGPRGHHGLAFVRGHVI